jgi:type IV secretory pathway TraG/TraD family ATPase VirD4
MSSHPVPPIVLWIAVILLVVLALTLAYYKLKELLPQPDFRFVRGAEIVPREKLAKRTRAKRHDAKKPQFLVGEIAIPVELEDRHFLLVGTSGSGKSTAIRQILPVVRARGARAIIMDLGSEFVSQFRQPEDLIFCPGDIESVLWNPLAEIKSEQDIDLVLRAIIPCGTTPDEETWRGHARNFMKALMLRLYENGEMNLERLRYYTSCGDKEQTAFLQEGSNPYKVNATSMTGTVKDMIKDVMQGLRHVPQAANFSVREWVKQGKGFLFITPNNTQRAALSTLINAFMNLAIAEALSAPFEQRYAPLFIVADELAAFDFDDLPGVLERGRKYGLTACAGIQNAAQLRQKYGTNGATTLLACFRVKVIFNPGDAETAELMAREIGRQEVESRNYSTTKSVNSGSATINYTQTERFAVMPEELMKLADRDCYLRLVGNYQVAKVRIPLS